MLTFEGVLLFVYVLFGVVAWALYGLGMILGRSKVMLLVKPRAVPVPAPRCSILIPAKDEERRIAACLKSALDQDYPEFEVIAVDDRSGDGTGVIMDELASLDSRLKVLHIQPASLTPGWTGKNNALDQASRVAGGEWLLFVDSDVVLEKTALSRTVALCAGKNYDLFSVLARMETHSIWEAMLIPVCSMSASAMYLGPFVNNDKRNKKAFANGQFLLTTRAAYDAIGGHAAVKGVMGEDMAIAALMQQRKLRVRVSMGDDICAIRMYDSFAGILKGWARIYYAAEAGYAGQIIGAIAFLLICSLSAYPMLGYGVFRILHRHGNIFDDLWLGAAVSHWMVLTVLLALVYQWSRASVFYALAFFLSGPLLLWILCKALMLCFTGKVEWRGTTYASPAPASLKAAKV